MIIEVFIFGVGVGCAIVLIIDYYFLPKIYQRLKKRYGKNE